MRPQLAVVTGIDPQVTKRFLLSQPDVVSADVWYQRGKLHAQVAVVDERTEDPSRLQQKCLLALGREQAPKEITFVNVRPRAA